MDLERLKKKRTVLRSFKTKLLKQIDCVLSQEVIEPDIIVQLEEFYSQLIEKTLGLKTIDSEIETVLPIEEFDAEITASQEIQEQLISYKNKLQNAIKHLSSISGTPLIPNFNNISNDQDSVGSGSINSVHKTYVKLPKLNINKFFGDPCSYIEFKNQFDSAIGTNDCLSKVDKFNYLKTLLGGSAASVINGFSLTDANYDSALKLLEDRFGRKDILISSHMNKLLNLEPVKNSSNLQALRHLYESCEIQIRSLDSLDVCSGTYGQLLCPILLKLMPEDLTLQFNRDRKNKPEFEVKELIAFIHDELVCREATVFVSDAGKKNQTWNPTRSGLGNNNRNIKNNGSATNFRNFRSTNIPTAAALVSSVQNSCVFCNSTTHKSKQCELDVEEKISKLKKDNRCLKCFKKGHRSLNCWAKIEECSCGKKNHAKEICRLINGNAYNTNSETAEGQVVVSSVSHTKPIDNKMQSSLLQTCSAKIKTENDTKICRILLDNASQRSFITQTLARELKLPILRREHLLIYSFGNRKPVEKTFEVSEVSLENVENSKLKIKVQVLLTDLITSGEIQIPDSSILDCLKTKKVRLADGFGAGKDIDILLGADVYWDVFTNKEKIGKQLTLIETILGYCVQGHSDDMMPQQNCTVNLTSVLNGSSTGEDVNNQLKDFWTLESMGIIDEVKDSNVESETMKQFDNNTVFKDGRYETKLLWLENPPPLDNNFQIANKRFQYLNNKLMMNNNLFNEYKAILDEQLSHGIIEHCSQEIKSDNTFYLPHAPVVCLNKVTTKIRIIYDGSSKGKNNVSLNDCLKVGVNLNPNILDVILKFREHKVAFCADIEKAFLQIVIAEEDRDYLRFLWYNDDPRKDKLWKILRITRNPFGLKCSPFILAATIKRHIKQYEAENKEAFDMLNHSLYVDDLFHGHSDVKTACELTTSAVNILKDANMNLRKFQTNSSELRNLWIKNGIIKEDIENENSLKVLGVKWDNKTDLLKLEIQSLIECIPNLKNTKRSVLQTAAKIFDPVGFISPFVTRIKCILQELWEKGMEWDDELPWEIKLKWDKWCSEIEDLKDFSIPRMYFTGGILALNSEVQLHIFSDANPNSYGAVAYMRNYREEQYNTSFVMSKSRVSPLKKLTLPRLELMGAVVASRIAHYLMTLFKIENKNVFLWTDSSITLHWIKGSAKEWKPFVSNRVIEIQLLTDPRCWRHCPGKSNPADKITKGDSAAKLVRDEVWFRGPPFLSFPEEHWPNSSIERDDLSDVISEKKTKVQVSLVECKPAAIVRVEDFSTVSRLLRVTAWVRRFLHNTRNRTNQRIGQLTSDEIAEAEDMWVKEIQKQSFPEEYEMLSQKKSIPRESPILLLDPFLDESGIIRIGGRLQHSSFAYEEKHPALLPTKHKFTELIVTHSHRLVRHSGVADTLTQVREKFWIIRGRQIIKSTLNRCIICKRFNARKGTQVMAPLPTNRVAEAPPFAITGLDFAGPLYTKDSDSKYYICIFACSVTRAIHLELVPNQNTETFLLALRRFISRRGICTTIYSDNSKTFKSAEKWLSKMWTVINHPKVKDFYSAKGIKWIYNVEKAAWWGGQYERHIRSVKLSLRKSIGKTSLSADELETVLIEIEAVINSRPITYVYSDSQEPSPLTPAHFLVGKRLLSLPCTTIRLNEYTNAKPVLVKRYNYREKLMNHFWKRWKKEYLLNLKSANSVIPTKNVNVFKVNDIVIICDEMYPRNMWKLGKILKVFPGRDGKIRSCEIKTESGTLKRPIQLICNLEI